MHKTLLFSFALCAAMTAAAQHRAPSEDSPLTIKANLVNKNGKADGAICAFQVPGNGTYETISSNTYFKDNRVGVWAGGQYYFTQYDEFWGTVYANFDAYSTASWERTQHVNSGLSWDDVATDLTYCLSDEKVYGCFPSDDHTDYYFGTLDLSTGHSTSISQLPQQMVGVASYCGTVYTIGLDGTLYSVATADGALTTIGQTGLEIDPNRLQSATCDPATGTIYWAAQLSGNESALYTVNPATAEATKLYNFPAREQWVGLFIEGEETGGSDPGTDPDPGPGVDPENPDTPDQPIVHENSYFEDFEDCDGNYYHEWLPYGWEDRSAVGHEGLNPDNWQSQQNLTWQVGSISQGTGHPAYAGDYCAFINVSTAWTGHPNEEQDEWLITPSIGVKPNEYLFFQYSYSPGWTRWNRLAWDYTGQNNTLEVHVSTDGGETWKKLWDCMELAGVMSDEELEADRSTTHHPYRPVYIDLADYADQKVRLAFRYVGINGQDMCIDDVTVGLPIPEARYVLPDGVYREALSPYMTYPKNPVLWAPAGEELVWESCAENAQQYYWTYEAPTAGEDKLTAESLNLTTPAYAAGTTVDVPALQVSFGGNKSLVFSDNYRRMQIEGERRDIDEEGKEQSFGIANYDILDPNAYVGFNRTFGFDQDSYDKWSGLCGRLVYTVVPSCAVSAYSAPLKPYYVTSIYANVKVEAIDPSTEVSCDVWVTDDEGQYITECIGYGHLMASEIESLYPDDEKNKSWSVMRFDFSDAPIYVDRKIYVMIGGFNLATDAVYFPGISTSTAENQAESYFGVIDYNDDAGGLFKLFDVNSYNIGTTGRRHLAGFLFGLEASYDVPEGIHGVVADQPADLPTALYDLQGRKLDAAPAQGLYIQGGKKVIR